MRSSRTGLTCRLFYLIIPPLPTGGAHRQRGAGAGHPTHDNNAMPAVLSTFPYKRPFYTLTLTPQEIEVRVTGQIGVGRRLGAASGMAASSPPPALSSLVLSLSSPRPAGGPGAHHHQHQAPASRPEIVAASEWPGGLRLTRCQHRPAANAAPPYDEPTLQTPVQPLLLRRGRGHGARPRTPAPRGAPPRSRPSLLLLI